MATTVKIDEEQRKYLLEIYASLIFLDDEETLNKCKCINCGHIAIMHNAANCKHVFCSKCMKEKFLEMCPKCENVEIVEAMRDDQFETRMLELHVECHNKSKGCRERITLHQYQEHEAKCPFSTKALAPKLYSGLCQNENLKEIEDNITQINTTINAVRKDVISSHNEINKSLSNLCDKVETINNDISKLKIASQEKENQKTIIQENENINKIIHENEQLKTRCDDLEITIHQLQGEMEVRKEFEQKARLNAYAQSLQNQGNEKLKTRCDDLEKLIRQLQSEMEIRKEFEKKNKLTNACAHQGNKFDPKSIIFPRNATKFGQTPNIPSHFGQSPF